jgi:acyl-coenzyme A synthetase/AMP-(fatty) acid ligase
MKVFPLEIETVLASHPAVLASHAYAVPDPRLGETVGVTVMLADPSTQAQAQAADELVTWCRARLAPLKQPTAWEFAPLTLTASGKLRRTTTPTVR